MDELPHRAVADLELALGNKPTQGKIAVLYPLRQPDFHSAWGPSADRHSKYLIDLMMTGSMLGAYSNKHSICSQL